MDSQSLINGLKDLFASLGAKTSDSNYAVGLFDKTSKEPKGVMGMSDLASVLGGLKKVSWQDPDNILETCLTYTGSVWINHGTQFSAGLLITFVDWYKVQFFSQVSDNKLYYRGSDETWTLLTA